MADKKPAPAFSPEAQAKASEQFVSKPSSAAIKAKRLDAIKSDVAKALDDLEPGKALPAIIQEAISLVDPPRSNDLALAEFCNSSYRINIKNIDLRLLHKNSVFWSALTNRGLQKFDRILAVSEDENSFANFVVIDADNFLVDCMMTDFHKIQRRPRPKSETAWLDDGDQLKSVASSAMVRGGFIIVRADGVEISDSGLPYLDVEAARRAYSDAAWRQNEKAVKYFPS